MTQPATVSGEPSLTGVARVDRRTKALIGRLQPGEIAVIDHEDLDGVDPDDQLFVGAPVLVAQGTLMLQELTPSPTWEALSTWRLGDLARITVGGRYQDLLDLAAPERPADPSPFAD